MSLSGYVVNDLDRGTAIRMIERYHYSQSAGKVAVFIHGLFSPAGRPEGAMWWLPSTKAAAVSVGKEHWRRVISLSRMVCVPGAPRNSCSFMLSRSAKLIKKDGRFDILLTYADEYSGHTGLVYKASGWEYVGPVGPYKVWIDNEGKQRSMKSSSWTFSDRGMENRGFKLAGRFLKHKFVRRL